MLETKPNHRRRLAPPPPPSLTIIGLAAVRQRTSLSGATIYRLIARGQFPRSVPITEGRRGWLLSEVDQWVADRVAQRDREAGE